MSKIRFALAMLTLVFSVISCDDGLGGQGGSTPNCDWGKEESVSFDKIEFSVPGGMSPWWKGQFPADNVIRNLWIVMGNKGDLKSSVNKAMVSGSITGGQGCKGIETFEQNKIGDKISTKSVKAPFPNNGFVVEANVRVRSDDFNNFSGSGSAYFVYWERRSNTFPINGRITGVKRGFFPESGKVSKQGYIIKGGSKIYL